MPQITLKISKNIDMSRLDLRKLFQAIHEILGSIPNLDKTTCYSGVIQEDFSINGLGDEQKTKMYLEVYWLENEARSKIKKHIAQQLMTLLEEIIVPQVENQNLICLPRVRIANLGELEQNYFISSRKPAI